MVTCEALQRICLPGTTNIALTSITAFSFCSHVAGKYWNTLQMSLPCPSLSPPITAYRSSVCMPVPRHVSRVRKLLCKNVRHYKVSEKKKKKKKDERQETKTFSTQNRKKGEGIVPLYTWTFINGTQASLNKRSDKLTFPFRVLFSKWQEWHVILTNAPSNTRSVCFLTQDTRPYSTFLFSPPSQSATSRARELQVGLKECRLSWISRREDGRYYFLDNESRSGM